MRAMLILAAALFAAGSAGKLSAQTATAFKTGENTTGQTKQCYYDFAGKQYTKTVESYQLCPLSIQVRTAPAPQPAPTPQPAPPSTVTAFKSGERTTGQTKQCYYDFAGKEYTKTVESYQLCPLSIQVRS